MAAKLKKSSPVSRWLSVFHQCSPVCSTFFSCVIITVDSAANDGRCLFTVVAILFTIRLECFSLNFVIGNDGFWPWALFPQFGGPILDEIFVNLSYDNFLRWANYLRKLVCDLVGRICSLPRTWGNLGLVHTLQEGLFLVTVTSFERTVSSIVKNCWRYYCPIIQVNQLGSSFCDYEKVGPPQACIRNRCFVGVVKDCELFESMIRYFFLPVITVFK